jgi:hypothetical protein
MNDIRQVKFSSESPINSAIMEIINAFAMAEIDGQNLFESVQEGNPTQSDKIVEDGGGICMRIYRAKPAMQQINTVPNFVFRKKVFLCIVPIFKLKVDQVTTIDGFGGIEPIDYYRENLRRFCQDVLEDLTLTGNLTSLAPGQIQYWNFGKQTEELEYESSFTMDLEKIIPLPKDWYSCPFYKILEVDVR